MLQLNESISDLRVVGWYFFIFIPILKGYVLCKRTVETLIRRRTMHCLPMSHKKDARLIYETLSDNVMN